MTDQQVKVLENRLRRTADRQGLRLEKSRVRDPRATDYGMYHLIDTSTNTVVAHQMQIEDVARELLNPFGIQIDTDPEHVNNVFVDNGPVLKFRDGSTTGVRVRGKLLPDGWVLYTDDGDQHIVGVYDKNRINEAMRGAEHYLQSELERAQADG